MCINIPDTSLNFCYRYASLHLASEEQISLLAETDDSTNETVQQLVAATAQWKSAWLLIERWLDFDSISELAMRRCVLGKGTLR